MNIQDECAKIHAQYGTSEMANYKIQQLLDSEIDKLKNENLKQRELIMSILGYDNPYNLRTVLEKLRFGTNHLLRVKNYDGHAYEELEQSVKRADEILNILSTKEAHFIP